MKILPVPIFQLYIVNGGSKCAVLQKVTVLLFRYSKLLV
uniref:Uncharacterized protein n=1 Tax=Arundo donax TaxID=35708 RepID=A0A0A8YM58_ARUDO